METCSEAKAASGARSCVSAIALDELVVERRHSASWSQRRLGTVRRRRARVKTPDA